MSSKPCRTAALVVLLGLSGALFAQARDNPGIDAGTPSGSNAPNTSRPADGAIQGGSILPGERGGMPSVGAPSEQAKNRCNDLSGTLREQCLAREAGASTGGTHLPDVDVARPPPTREAPPPQNPR